MHMHTAGFLLCHQLNFALQAQSLFDTFMSYFVGYSLIVLGAKIWQGDDIKKNIYTYYTQNTFRKLAIICSIFEYLV